MKWYLLVVSFSERTERDPVIFSWSNDSIVRTSSEHVSGRVHEPGTVQRGDVSQNVANEKGNCPGFIPQVNGNDDGNQDCHEEIQHPIVPVEWNRN